MPKLKLRDYWALAKLLLPIVSIVGVTIMLLSATINMNTGVLNVRTWGALEDSPRAAGALHTLFFFVVILLILVNTVIYAFDSLALAESKRAGSGRQYRAVLVLTWVCILGALGWLVDLVFFGKFSGTFSGGDDFMALAMFVVFSIVDLLLFLGASQSFVPDGTTAVRTPEGAEKFLHQLLFVDFPVVIGILVVIMIRHEFLEHAEVFGGGGRDYLEGFASGAVVMHLAASQVIFAAIYLRSFFKGLRADL